ncbi:MAG: hypothetical protein KKF67_01435 [Nanoarchaeota archaeon]|nr:hypothetical protein [Nanoarchaeota archaeon]
MKKNKIAAMEMSIGTIVTIVLLMTTLVLGLILINSIFKNTKGAIDLTAEQLTNQIGKAFGSGEDKVVIYPESGKLTIKQEDEEAVGIGIRNLLTGVSGSQKFFYNITIAESNGCGNENLLNWIQIGKSESNIPISVGDYYVTKTYFKIPLGAPLCTVKYRVEVKTADIKTGKLAIYDSITFVITSKAK